MFEMDSEIFDTDDLMESLDRDLHQSEIHAHFKRKTNEFMRSLIKTDYFSPSLR